MENSTKNCVVISSKDYTPELQKALEEFRAETISRMDALKKQFGLKSLELSHGYIHRLWLWVNKDVRIDYFKPVNHFKEL